MTIRLDVHEIARPDAAVAAGSAPSRSSAIALAMDWHDRERDALLPVATVPTGDGS